MQLSCTGFYCQLTFIGYHSEKVVTNYRIPDILIVIMQYDQSISGALSLEHCLRENRYTGT